METSQFKGKKTLEFEEEQVFHSRKWCYKNITKETQFREQFKFNFETNFVVKRLLTCHHI